MSVPERPPVEAGGAASAEKGLYQAIARARDRHTRGLNIFYFSFASFLFVLLPPPVTLDRWYFVFTLSASATSGLCSFSVAVYSMTFTVNLISSGSLSG